MTLIAEANFNKLAEIEAEKLAEAKKSKTPVGKLDANRVEKIRGAIKVRRAVDDWQIWQRHDVMKIGIDDDKYFKSDNIISHQEKKLILVAGSVKNEKTQTWRHPREEDAEIRKGLPINQSKLNSFIVGGHERSGL